MCGIIAVLRKRSERTPPSGADLLALLDGTADTLRSLVGSVDGAAIDAVAQRVEEVDAHLRGTPGVRALLDDRALASSVEAVVADLDTVIVDVEAGLDAGVVVDVTAVEAANAAIVRLKDACWAVRRDRLPTARAVADLAGASPSRSAVEGFTSIQLALSAIDRLEVRGRDSAGIEVLVHGHGLDLANPPMAALLDGRDQDPLYVNGAVRATPEGHLSFVYKAAATIGELGDNTRALRDAIRDDALLHRALDGPVSGSARAELHRLSDGNLQVLTELVRGARERNVLVEAGGAWDLVGPLSTTTALDELVAEHLAGVDPEGLAVLELPSG